MPRKKPHKPKYVVFNDDKWIVRRSFPTPNRTRSGRIIYVTIGRDWEPQTDEAARQIAEDISNDYYAAQKRAQRGLSDPTFGEVAERLLTAKKKAVSDRTYTFYSELYENSIKGTAFSRRPIAEIKTLEIQDFYDQAEVSPDRIRKLNVFLSMTFAQAISWDLAAKNPTAGVMLPQWSQSETPSFSRVQAKKLMAALFKEDRFIKFALALETGLRPQEVMALPMQNLSLSFRRVRVTQALAAQSTAIKEPKTPASIRTVGFSKEFAERLKIYLANREQWIAELKRTIRKPLLLEHMKRKGVNYERRKSQRKQARETLDNVELYSLVFPASNGAAQSVHNASERDFKAALDLAGFDDSYSFESLRHTNLSLLAEEISPRRLQKHAGHQRIETTLKYYVHIDDKEHDVVPDKVAGLLY